MTEETEKTELTEEEQLAQEALDATSEESPAVPAEEEPEVVVDPKDAVIGEFRRGLRDANAEIAVLKAAQTVPTAKSPIELAQAQATEAGVTLEFTPELYKAERAFEQKQTKVQTDQQAYDQKMGECEAGMSAHQPEINRLNAIGGHLLTQHDKGNIFEAGKNSGKESIRILKVRIEQAGLQSKPKAKTEVEDKPKDEKKKADETPEGEENIPMDPVTARGVALFYK